ncbi:MAG: hypothetical protein HKN85_12270 [Gammaproteobacteria bacterium]|nr:hypothetical protein [Gammaproteobacteria bacterium]
MFNLKTLLIVVMSATLYTTAAVAKTPDGLTPAEETICDAFSGSAFGLCNAFCEAMDCGDPNQAASDTGCLRVNDNFAKRTGFRLPEGYRYDNSGNLLNNCIIAQDE